MAHNSPHRLCKPIIWTEERVRGCQDQAIRLYRTGAVIFALYDVIRRMLTLTLLINRTETSALQAQRACYSGTSADSHFDGIFQGYHLRHVRPPRSLSLKRKCVGKSSPGAVLSCPFPEYHMVLL